VKLLDYCIRIPSHQIPALYTSQTLPTPSSQTPCLYTFVCWYPRLYCLFIDIEGLVKSCVLVIVHIAIEVAYAVRLLQFFVASGAGGTVIVGAVVVVCFAYVILDSSLHIVLRIVLGIVWIILVFVFVKRIP
jgi:hypothetical protein